MTEPGATIDWSYTNAQLYSSCPRSLFYHYWYRHGGSAKDTAEETSEQFWQSTKGALVGTAVHKSISTQVTRWATGRNTNRKEAFDTAFSYIRSAEIGSDQCSVEGEDEINSLISTVEDHLDRFLSVIWPQLRTGRYITHETTYSFQTDGTTVWVRPDLCHRDQHGQFVITDWKTRQPGVFEDPTLQLLVYALWALKEFEPDPGNLKLQLAFTSTGEIRPQPLKAQQIEEVRDRIQRDSTAWSDPQDRSNFPVDPAPQKCSTCSYLPSCSAGNEVLKSISSL